MQFLFWDGVDMVWLIQPIKVSHKQNLDHLPLTLMVPTPKDKK